MDGGAWWAAVHGVAKSRTRLSDLTFTVHFHALEKETATQSSVLAWRIPGTGEAGGLPSMGLHSVGLKRLSSIYSEVHQKEKNKSCILTHIHGISKDGTDEPIWRAAMETQIKEQTYRHEGQERERGTNGESTIYTTICKTDSQWEFAV